MLESENRQLKNSQEAAAQHRVASIPTPAVVPFPTATVVIAASESPTVEVDAAIDVLPPVDWQAVPGGFQFSSDMSGDTSSAGPDSEQVNANVRSSILPFSDAKIYRAA